MKDAIHRGEWAAGQKLPSEQELAEEFHVSRATLREAIGLLLSDGLVVKRHGVGNFVADTRLSAGLETLQSTTDWILASGMEPGTLSKQCRIRPATEEECAELGLFKSDKVIEVSRIRTADRVPIVYSRDRIPAKLLVNADEALGEFDEKESLLGVLEQFGIVITEAVATVNPRLPDPAVRNLLRLQEAEIVLHLKQIHLDTGNKPCLYSDIFLNSGKLQFQVIRKRSPWHGVTEFSSPGKRF